MSKIIKRIDKAGSYQTTFVLFDDVTNQATEINIPVWQADDVVTAIQNASWATITALFNLTGESVIKTE